MDGGRGHERLPAELRPHAVEAVGGRDVSLPATRAEIPDGGHRAVRRNDARRAHVSLLLYQSRFPVRTPAFQYCEDPSHRHHGDMAAHGIYGSDLLVPARRIWP